jgi:large subunit ribosomal protein L21
MRFDKSLQRIYNGRLLRRLERFLVPATESRAMRSEVIQVYAVVETGGKQYKVTVGETIRVEALAAERGDSVTLERVLLVVDGEEVQVGQPTVEGASVAATVLEHAKGRKAVIFRYRPKQRYRVKKGHRQSYTRLHIDEIKA